MARLRALTPALVTVPRGTLLHRVYFKGGEHPTAWHQLRTFGPLSRFDHHRRDASGHPFEQEDRGVLYAATDIPTALAETFQRYRRINRARRQPWLASFRLAEPITLLDLTGSFCVQAGASAKLITGPFVHAQNWSQGFYDAYSIAGLYYRSSLTQQPNVVLFERGASSLPDRAEFNRALNDAAWHHALVRAAQQIGYEIL